MKFIKKIKIGFVCTLSITAASSTAWSDIPSRPAARQYYVGGAVMENDEIKCVHYETDDFRREESTLKCTEEEIASLRQAAFYGTRGTQTAFLSHLGAAAAGCTTGIALGGLSNMSGNDQVNQTQIQLNAEDFFVNPAVIFSTWVLLQSSAASDPTFHLGVAAFSGTICNLAERNFKIINFFFGQ